MNYAEHVSTKTTPQNEPVPGKPTMPNSAGGFSFAVDDWVRLERFLVLGCEGGSYYATERKLTQENAAAVICCVKADGAEAVRRIAAISEAGRAPKNDPAIFALALAAAHGDPAAKGAAYAALPRVCRTGTHLFQFAAASNELRGWGRGLRKAVADWYLTKSPRDLAYQVTKYQQRDGWSHRDLLRLAHVRAADDERQGVFRWVTHGADAAAGPLSVRRSPAGREAVEVVYPAVTAELPVPIRAFEMAKRATTAAEVAGLIREFRLVRECIPTQFLDAPEVWEALLAEMPLTAMLRNLATLTRAGILAPDSDGTRKVVADLIDAERLRKARLHPLAVLVALKTYAQGHGVRGKTTWTPVQEIVDALDAAFYLAFRAVVPTGKRWLLALDVSGSMTCGQVGGMTGISPRVGSAAMALVTAATEADHHIMGFSNTLVPVDIGPGMRLDAAIRAIDGVPMGGTDCALPMLYAAEQKRPVDVFVVYTDSETWFGKVHPFQALQQYRDTMGIPAKLVVVGMVSNGFTIADPSDAGMLDVVGFNTTAPAVIADFARDGAVVMNGDEE